jgi:hypothetical protein
VIVTSEAAVSALVDGTLELDRAVQLDVGAHEKARKSGPAAGS